jgi:hypothetical protein
MEVYRTSASSVEPLETCSYLSITLSDDTWHNLHLSKV